MKKRLPLRDTGGTRQSVERGAEAAAPTPDPRANMGLRRGLQGPPFCFQQ